MRGFKRGRMDKRSMTLDIPVPRDAALTGCSHVDNMCCLDSLRPPCKTRAQTEKQPEVSVTLHLWSPSLSDLCFNLCAEGHCDTD